MRFDVPSFRAKFQHVVATTTPGDRRDPMPDRRRNHAGQPRDGDRRKVVVRSGQPTWFDRRVHIVGQDGRTVVAERTGPDAPSDIVPVAAPTRLITVSDSPANETPSPAFTPVPSTPPRGASQGQAETSVQSSEEAEPGASGEARNGESSLPEAMSVQSSAPLNVSRLLLEDLAREGQLLNGHHVNGNGHHSHNGRSGH